MKLTAIKDRVNCLTPQQALAIKGGGSDKKTDDSSRIINPDTDEV